MFRRERTTEVGGGMLMQIFKVEQRAGKLFEFVFNLRSIKSLARSMFRVLCAIFTTTTTTNNNINNGVNSAASMRACMHKHTETHILKQMRFKSEWAQSTDLTACKILECTLYEQLMPLDDWSNFSFFGWRRCKLRTASFRYKACGRYYYGTNIFQFSISAAILSALSREYIRLFFRGNI
uniref:Uncharacterized protein n=1 Tax=Glossina pallidipes TaxID=7398 RepID=A0A1B0A5T0_GLOPL